jgi:hypothetical protein
MELLAGAAGCGFFGSWRETKKTASNVRPVVRRFIRQKENVIVHGRCFFSASTRGGVNGYKKTAF